MRQFSQRTIILVPRTNWYSGNITPQEDMWGRHSETNI